MPARDVYHAAVKAALIADGWTISHDPYRLIYGGKDAYVDLAAQRERPDTTGAGNHTDRIAIEIKTFTGLSILADLEQALGQYLLYRTWMRRTEPARALYLAVDEETARGVFAQEFGRIVADDLQMRLIVIDMRSERIVEWKHFPATDRP